MQLRITILPASLAVCRLAPDAPIPYWARGEFVSVTRTRAELSVMCDERDVPLDVRAEVGWKALRVEGPLPFDAIGVAAAVVLPLAEAGISVLPVATYDTDYLLVHDRNVARAADVLRDAGHHVA